MSEPIVRVQNASVLLNRTLAVDDVSFDAHENQVLAIMGPNGSGKTTLLRALAGLVHTKGKLSVAGNNLQHIAVEERASLVAYVPQQTELNIPLSVESVVAHGRYAMRAAPQEAKGAVETAMQQVDVLRMRHKAFTELSGGERRRVLLARALASHAPVLLLDEPASSLDVAHALQFYTLIQDLARQGRTILMTLHAPHDAQRFSDRILLLQQGKLLAQGPTQEILASAELHALYGIQSRVESTTVYYVQST